ncbi:MULTISPECIES: alkene reductase [Microbacterium]|uniref:Alkene reductase n=1 Tax=Microbacterium wangchenii TaxID=2541726 RepID=A0ABX5SVD1_9MICO|nr:MULTISPECIES: alkene reductase [Microbacterium]MCK6065791.1 alkene reductase [Microbacterium sp. EYE_512]QBR90104.1 alkene reductase [Microbacterium wangchenii]TXK11880.1 alkene reductase [Microbacterium wangchenii]
MSDHSAPTPVTAFEPITIGSLRLRNRIVMAPMTRSRAFGTRANADMATYYAQRAGAGLIITEGTQPSPVGQGYPDTPGLHTNEQVEAWAAVTGAVHEAGGVIVAQLMHTGRIGHPATTAAVGSGALTPVAPSAVRAAGSVFTPEGPRDHVQPAELNEDEIRATIADFAAAARNAVAAGFDGVEVHGANGYLLHQFLATNANQRTDDWGGSARNRIRFTVEVVEAVAAAIGADRTGLRISPANGLGDTTEDDAATLYPLLVERLNGLQLAYLHLVEAGDAGLTPVIRAAWKGALILNAVTPDSRDDSARLDRVARGEADLVSFARAYIANPDLVDRLAEGAPLAEPDLTKAYGGGREGYTDYPVLARDGASA